VSTLPLINAAVFFFGASTFRQRIKATVHDGCHFSKGTTHLYSSIYSRILLNLEIYNGKTTGGGGRPGPVLVNENVEIYSPPYLFQNIMVIVQSVLSLHPSRRNNQRMAVRFGCKLAMQPKLVS
jgi:hypothetical protein